MNAALVIKDLEAAYPGSTEGHVLNGISFKVEHGERVALVGANGAGKSTLLLCAAGVLPIHGGEIKVDGLKVEKQNLAEVRRTAALVFQNPDDQLFSSTVWEDVLFGALNYLETENRQKRRAARLEHHAAGLAQIEAEAASLLASLDIFHLKDKMPHKLSGGEKRRAALACVLIMKPKILLLDEPSAFLDPRARRNLIATLAAIPQTQIMATHDFDLARAVCSRCVLLHNGCAAAEGTTEELLSDAALLERCGL